MDTDKRGEQEGIKVLMALCWVLVTRWVATRNRGDQVLTVFAFNNSPFLIHFCSVLTHNFLRQLDKLNANRQIPSNP